ncbi:MAG: molybdopterin molybdotransferase MoeA [Coriobacteriaceae bacterium]|nr:molybdopterin molybdotransferase MoeA [Coriobacteriaceae bacterium]
MRDHSKHIQLTREQAIEKLVEVSEFAPRTELVDLHGACGRVTAADCSSRYDIPSALCSQMDGIAVHFDDFADGMPDVSTWTFGKDYAWANTGTAMPAGFDTAIAIEQVEFDDAGMLVALKAIPSQRGASCNQPGSTFAKGELLIPARTRLTPTKISALAMCGYTEVEVVAKPRVAFIPTGDELVEMGCELPAGKAYESNGILLEQKLRLWGAEPVIYPCLPDDWDQIKAAILDASEKADIVAINAGSSKGAKDFTMEILEEIGTVFCHETNHGPGHHTSASQVNGTPVLGISGPPTGCEITSDWYLKPLVDYFLYGHIVEFTTATATLAQPLGGGHGKSGKPGGAPRKKVSSDFFAIRPVKVAYGADGLTVEPIPGSKHHNLLQLDEADAYVEKNPAELAGLEPGARIEVELRFPYRTD